MNKYKNPKAGAKITIEWAGDESEELKNFIDDELTNMWRTAFKRHLATNYPVQEETSSDT